MLHIGFAIAHVKDDALRRSYVTAIRRECPRAAVVNDVKQSCWDTTRRAWIQAAREPAATHVVAMADDQIPCKGFLTYIYGAVDYRPDGIIAYWTMRNVPLDEAKTKGFSWIKTPDGAAGGATVMPVDLMWDFLLWEGKEIDPAYPHDDVRLKLFAWKERLDIWITAPSLCQHEGVESLMGHPSAIGGKPRRSAWVADNQRIEWDTGHLNNKGSLDLEREWELARRKDGTRRKPFISTEA